MAKQLSRRRLIASGTASAIGTLALTGCTPRHRPKHGGRDAGLTGPQADCLTFGTIWPRDPDAQPETGYNRCARAVFKLADMWRRHADSDGGRNSPTVGQLLDLIAQPDFEVIKDIPTHPNGRPTALGLWPPLGSDGDSRFRLLWDRLRETAAGFFVLAGYGPRRRWLHCPNPAEGGWAAPPEAAAYLSVQQEADEPEFGVREDGLSPPERRSLTLVVQQLDQP